MPPPINLEDLTESELIDLNHRIVARLRVIRSVRDHERMVRFSIGDRVCFTDRRTGREIRGVLILYNRRSVSVLAEDGARWTVGPSLLRSPADGARTATVRVVRPLRELPG